MKKAAADASFLSYLGLAAELAAALLVPSMLGFFLGLLIDRSFTTAPLWTIIMILLGIVTGIRSMWKLVIK